MSREDQKTKPEGGYVTQSRNTPLKMRTSGGVPVEVIEQLLAVTSRVNQHEERISAIEVDMMAVVGETSRSNQAVIAQVNTLADVVRELREVLVPASATTTRQKLITIPNIDIAEIRSVLNEDELNRRRQESIRVRAEQTEKEKVALEDAFASKRDARNAKFALYIGLGVAVFTELLRILITHSP